MNLLDIESQQVVLSSIFPEKIQYDGKKCRTPKINETVRLILATDKGSRNKKERDKLENAGLSLRVEPGGIEPPSRDRAHNVFYMHSIYCAYTGQVKCLPIPVQSSCGFRPCSRTMQSLSHYCDLP